MDASLIPGILYYSDVCLSFLNADVPAYRVSPPQKVAEYFAAGKPVICNKIAPHEWLVDHGVNGFVLDPDPLKIAEYILKLKNDKITYTKMSANAQETAKQHDIDKIYGKMIQKIKDALNELQSND